MKILLHAVKTSVFVCSVAVLTACGGGGDATTTSPLNFSLLSAWQEYSKQTRADNFTISGSCSGSGSSIENPIAASTGSTKATTGQGTPISFSKSSTLSAFYSNCEGSGSESRVMYFDSNYHPIQVEFPLESSAPFAGEWSSNQRFVVYHYTSSIPVLIRPNDSITLGSVDVLREYCYYAYVTDCRVSKVGGGDLSVVARTERTDSILVDFVINIALDGQASKNTTTFRLTSSGVLSPVNEVIESGGSREIWTY